MSVPMIKTEKCTMALVVAAVIAAYPAQAVSQGLSQLEEVVVTAQKREQSAQDIPLSVAAFTGDSFGRIGATDITAVNGIAPNIVLQTEGLIPNIPMFSIRGMSHSDPDPNSDPKTSMVIDGVYVPFAAASMLDMFDIDRVEILRGPQGTLFGKNNLAGTISVITSRPTGEFGGKLSATAGENGLQHYKFKVNTASFANDTLSAKLAGSYREYDGYTKNITTGSDLNKQEVGSVRGAINYVPTDNFDATLIVDYTDDTTDGPGGHSTAVPEIQGDVYKAALNFDPRTETDSTGVTLEANWDIDVGVLSAVLGYRDLNYDNRGDFDGTPYFGTPPQQALDVSRNFDGDNQSIELRFASNWNDMLDYVAGVYYSNDDWTQVNDVKVFEIPPIGSLGTNKQEGKSYAAFAQGDLVFLDDFTLTLGGRYTKDEKDYSLESASVAGGVVGAPFLVEKSDDWDHFSPRVALEYRFSDDAMIYASVSDGYKGGGYNSRATLPDLVGPYDEETVTAYEIGIKSDWMDGKLRLNAAAFFNDYDDLQVGVQRPGSIRAESITTNVASAEISGIEVELTYIPMDNMQIGLNVGLLDSEYTDFCDDTNGASDYMPSNCGGFETEFAPGQWLIAEDQTDLDLANAPDTSASLTLDYDLPVSFGVFSFHGDARYTDEYNTWGRDNDDGFYRDSVTLINGNIKFTDSDERYTVTVFGRNLSDEEVISGAVKTGANPITQFYQPPREFGVELTYAF